MSDVLISAAYSRSAGLLKNGKKEDRKKCEGKKKRGGRRSESSVVSHCT